MPNQTNPMLAGSEAMVDAFRSISTLYMTSARKLVELNMATMRDAVERTTEAARTTADTRSPTAMQTVLFQPMLETAQTYTRDALEIVVGTQQEVIKVLMSQFGQGNPAFAMPGDWGSAFEAFNSGMRRFSGIAAEAASEEGEAPRQPFRPAAPGKRSA